MTNIQLTLIFITLKFRANTYSFLLEQTTNAGIHNYFLVLNTQTKNIFFLISLFFTLFQEIFEGKWNE